MTPFASATPSTLTSPLTGADLGPPSPHPVRTVTAYSNSAPAPQRHFMERLLGFGGKRRLPVVAEGLAAVRAERGVPGAHGDVAGHALHAPVAEQHEDRPGVQPAGGEWI